MKRSEILATALKCFSIHGYFGCSMQQIADSLGINKATLYHYCKSKQELFLAVFDIYQGNFVKNFTQISTGRNDESLRSVIFHISHQIVSSTTLENVMFMKGTQNMLASNAEEDLIQTMLERLSRVNGDIYKALNHQFFSHGLDMEQESGQKFFASYFVFINGFFDWMLLNAYVSHQDVTTMLNILLEAFWEGCGSMLPSAT